MSMSANDLLKYSADMMRIIARENKENKKEKEIKNILERITAVASAGYFTCCINTIEYDTTFNLLDLLGYRVKKVENSAETFAWKISWEGGAEEQERINKEENSP